MEKCPVEGCDKVFDAASDRRNKASLRSHLRFGHRNETSAVLPEATASNVASARQRSDTGTETLQEKVVRLRKERKPIGQPERKWACPEGDGYQYRVFNDDWMTRPGNIQRALEAGYEFVDSKEEKQKPKIVGTNDNGTPIKGILMRIPKEIFDEDQAAKQRQVDKVDEQIRAGKFQQGAGDKRYIPTTGIKITSDTRQPDM